MAAFAYPLEFVVSFPVAASALFNSERIASAAPAAAIPGVVPPGVRNAYIRLLLELTRMPSPSARAATTESRAPAPWAPKPGTRIIALGISSRARCACSGYVAPTTAPTGVRSCAPIKSLPHPWTRAATVSHIGCSGAWRSWNSPDEGFDVFTSTNTPRPARARATNGASASLPRYGFTVTASQPKSPLPRNASAISGRGRADIAPLGVCNRDEIERTGKSQHLRKCLQSVNSPRFEKGELRLYRDDRGRARLDNLATEAGQAGTFGDSTDFCRV